MRRLIVVIAIASALPAIDLCAARDMPTMAVPEQAGRGSVTVCHGFGCKYEIEIALTPADHAVLARLMAAGRASPSAERRAVAAAGAWFDRRIASVAGTKNHMARAGVATMMNTKGQFDCIDTSHNTTNLLLLLDTMRLLHHHTPDEPVARGFIIDGQMPHATAVLAEKSGGARWAVDAWTRAYGQAPEIMPLGRWMDGN